MKNGTLFEWLGFFADYAKKQKINAIGSGMF